MSILDCEVQFVDDAPELRRLEQQIALLLTTRVGSVPLDREFGIAMDFVDAPPLAAKSLYVAEVMQKIKRFIPGAQVQAVEWLAAPAGELKPKVVIGSAGNYGS